MGFRVWGIVSRHSNEIHTISKIYLQWCDRQLVSLARHKTREEQLRCMHDIYKTLNKQLLSTSRSDALISTHARGLGIQKVAEAIGPSGCTCPGSPMGFAGPWGPMGS